MVLQSDDIPTNSGMCIYAYVNNKAKLVEMCEWISWYKKSKILIFDSTWGGAYPVSYYKLSKSQLNKVYTNLLLQLLFAVAFIGGALVVTKYRREEK